MTADVRPLTRRRDPHPQPTPTPPIRVIADALTELAREHHNLPDTAIDTILWAILPTVHSTDRWTLYHELQTWQEIADDPCDDPESEHAKTAATDTITTLVAEAVQR